MARGLPSNDSKNYYDPVSPSSTDSSDEEPSPVLTTNSGNKLHPAARMIRRGKMTAWSPAYEQHKSDQRIRSRLRLCMEQFLPDAAKEVGTLPPPNVVKMEAKRADRKRKREEEAIYVLPHLRSPSPPMSTADLAPMMTLPKTYVDIMISPAMRHSLADDTVEQGLQRTASELLEGEKGLMQALGRLREVLRVRERDVPEGNQLAPPSESKLNGDHHIVGLQGANGDNSQPAANGALSSRPASTEPGPSTPMSGTTSIGGRKDGKILPLPHISDVDNLWRVTQELLQGQPQPTVSFQATEPGAADPPTEPEPIPTPVQRLFTIPGGLTIKAVPSPSHPGLRLPVNHVSRPHTVKYNLDMTAQTRAVDDALERISELLADCTEYKQRLEEARDRVADVSRARKKVWAVVKERAARELDRDGKV